MSLLSFSAYARSKGWSQQYVSKLVKLGKIVTVDGKIDPAAADRMLADCSDPGMVNVRAAHAEKRKSPPTKARPTGVESDEEGDEAIPFELMTQNDALTAKLQIQAKVATLDYQRKVGEVVQIVDLSKGLHDLISVAAEQIKTVADRISARAAAETDPRKVRDLIDAEMLAIQQQIADGGITLLERLTAASQ